MLTLLQSRGPAWALAVGVGGALLLVLVARGLLGHTPHYDELLHVLSARGLLESGAPAIADGLYTRARAFTQAVAWSFALFGDNLVAARLPALLAGAALVLLLGAWLTSRAGVLAGATGAILLCAVPASVAMAVFARFYTPHALAVTLMLIAFFEALEPGRRWSLRALFGVLGVLMLVAAWHLQATTLIALGAGMAGVLAVLVHDRWDVIGPVVRRYPLRLGALLVAAGGLLLLVVTWGGMLEKLGETALWAEKHAGRYQYYLTALRSELPLLWPLLPFATVVALVHGRQRRLVIFAVVVAGVALVTHSVAAQKAMRYIYYVIPWLCVLWACAVAAALDYASRGAAGDTGRPSARVAWVVVALLGVTFVLSVEGTRTLNLAAGRLAAISDLPYQDEPDWAPARSLLRSHADAADRVVTSNSMKAVYFLGRYDLELNATIVPETEERTEFGRDPRTGRRVISRPESMSQLLATQDTTLVVLEEPKIGSASGVPPETFGVIQASCNEVRLPAGTRVRAWWCGPAP